MADKSGVWGMRYILSLTGKNPNDNMMFYCDSLEEKDKYYQMAIEQGYEVKVKAVDEDDEVKKPSEVRIIRPAKSKGDNDGR